jgi:flagellar hook-basal body complex protein FliE
MSAEPTTSFGEVFFRAFDRVNQTQIGAAAMTQAMITDPDSVDIHNVSIAMAEANMAISMTKSIVDRAVQAYRTITTLR